MSFYNVSILIGLTAVFYSTNLDKFINNKTRATMPSSHHTPNSGSTSPLSGDIKIAEESQDNYPDIKFWNKNNWTTYADCEKFKPTDPMADGKVHTAPFIEDKSGNPVSVTQLKAIRLTARRIWETFEANGEAPPQWGKANSKIVNTYRHEMRGTHPELRLCLNDWKSEALATMGYPSWYQNRKKGIKKEADFPVLDTKPTTQKRSKRKVKEGGGGGDSAERERVKKQKTVGDETDPGQNGEDIDIQVVNDHVIDCTPKTGDEFSMFGMGLKKSDESNLGNRNVSGEMSRGLGAINHREGQTHGDHVEPGASSKPTGPSLRSWVCIHI